MTELLDPELEWRNGVIPISSRFGDPYYSVEGGLAESRYVFLAGVGLPNDWFGKRQFTIAELGFGTGLNFLTTWKAWRDSKQSGQLHFVSVEGYPMGPDDLYRSHQAFPEIHELSECLRNMLPERSAGYHLLRFDHGQVNLLLIYSHVANAFKGMHFKADAWLLDGFAPSRNPEMWTEELFYGVASLAKIGSRIATFTVAGTVRRGLEEVGFDLIKRPGFGSKRECLSGYFRSSTQINHNILCKSLAYAPLSSEAGPVAVIGAGIAGSSAARALTDSGVDTLIFDRQVPSKLGLSGLPSAILQPRPLSDGSPTADFFAAAFDYAANLYNSLDCVWVNRGVLVLGRDDHDATRYRKLRGGKFLYEVDCNEISGLDLNLPGVWFANGGVLDAAQVCKQLGAGSTQLFGRTIIDIVRVGKVWVLRDNQDKSYEVAGVVLAGGMETLPLSSFPALGLRANRGQISFLKSSACSQRLKAAVTFGGYLTPARTGYHILGASFDREQEWSDGGWKEVREESHARNLRALTTRIPSISKGLSVSAGGWTGLRATTPDRLPILGLIPDPIACEIELAPLREGKEIGGLGTSICHDSLYVLSGFGSRGFLMAPLAAKILVSQMLNQPLPVPLEFLNAIHPVRFLMRDMKRNRA